MHKSQNKVRQGQNYVKNVFKKISKSIIVWLYQTSFLQNVSSFWTLLFLLHSGLLSAQSVTVWMTSVVTQHLKMHLCTNEFKASIFVAWKASFPHTWRADYFSLQHAYIKEIIHMSTLKLKDEDSDFSVFQRGTADWQKKTFGFVADPLAGMPSVCFCCRIDRLDKNAGIFWVQTHSSCPWAEAVQEMQVKGMKKSRNSRLKSQREIVDVNWSLKGYRSK